MVAGGGEVYAALLPFATHQVLTEVDLEPEGDVHYPQFPAGEWVETAREAFDGYERVWLERMVNPPRAFDGYERSGSSGYAR